MLKIELIPDLEHCIETVVKREYATVLKQLLAPGHTDNKLQEKAEILRSFLETADFKSLRSESERQLMEGGRVRFVIYLEDGIPKYEIHQALVN